MPVLPPSPSLLRAGGFPLVYTTHDPPPACFSHLLPSRTEDSGAHRGGGLTAHTGAR
ncbi:unnamed protein product, partial [Gulo gulo]